MRFWILEDPPQQIIDYLLTFQVKSETPATEVSRQGLTKILDQKGYRAKAPETIQKICKKFKITEIRRGRQCFYPVEQINKIPNYK